MISRNTTLYVSFFAIFQILIFASCSSGSKRNSDSDSTPMAYEPEEFHADHDIAMTVRSIIDAINVGQRLDSVHYNYTGVLTDGNGRPLYTDVMGSPGAWEVKVRSEKSAVISNLYLGDLLDDELVEYLLQSLNITDEPTLEADSDKKGNDDELTIYRVGKADFIVEQQTAKAPNGEEGPLMKIIIRQAEFTPDTVPSAPKNINGKSQK